jgi:hypothetical protein
MSGGNLDIPSINLDYPNSVSRFRPIFVRLEQI